MSQIEHLTITLNQSYTNKQKALIEYKLRRFPCVVSACFLEKELSIYTTDKKLLVNILARFKLLDTKSSLQKKISDSKEAMKSVSEELQNYKHKAIASLLGFCALEGVKRFAPLTFANLTWLRSAFVLYIAKDIFFEGIGGLIRDKAPNADTLTATAVSASLFAGKPESSLSLLVLSNVAEMLTTKAAERARQHISSLLNVKEKYVWCKADDNSISKTPIEDIKVGDKVVVYLGEKICVDGRVIEGAASIDQSSFTGESIPVFKTVGADVFAGTVLCSGEITIQVTQVGDKTNLARIINMVENAQNRRAPIQNFADRMANSLVPISFLSAAVIYAVTKDIQRVLNMFFIDFSCGLKLSTSTAISASISKAAQMGVLVKGGNFIETLADIDTVILDKTGTITDGHPVLVDTIVADGVTTKELVQLAGSAEKSSSHPLAEAILNYAQKESWTLAQETQVDVVVGRGIVAKVPDFDDVKGGKIIVGSYTFMKEKKVKGLKDAKPTNLDKESNIIYVARDGAFLGGIIIVDPIRKDIKKTLNRFRRNGVDEILMLTGDNKVTADYVADKLDLDGFKAEVLPHEKADFVASKQSYSKVLMVGDGINDAPALAYADIGVALGGKSTDIAIESADITITSDEPLKLAKVMELSKSTMQIIRQNFVATIAINSAAMMLGALGKINPLIATTIHNAATIGVVANSARILLDKKFTFEKIKRNIDNLKNNK